MEIPTNITEELEIQGTNLKFPHILTKIYGESGATLLVGT